MMRTQRQLAQRFFRGHFQGHRTRSGEKNDAQGGPPHFRSVISQKAKKRGEGVENTVF
jgi:hypothetical protein